MKRFSEQFKARAETVKLRAVEKRDLRERLVSYMEYHPLPKGQPTTPGLNTNDEFASLKVIRLNLWRTMQYLGAGVGVFLLLVTYMAERAVPGDALYAVKVGVNEEVRATMARTAYDKVVWETERMNRRIAEARLLASEGRLTEAVEEQVAQAVRTHSDNARKEIAELKQVDQEEAVLASIKLSAALDVQAATLATEDEFLSVANAVGPTTNLIASAISEAIASEVLATAEELPGYDRLIARTEQEMVRAYELLASVKEQASNNEEADLLRRLNDIERTIGEAMSLRGTDEVLARETLVQALERAQKLIVFMSNIDVSSTLAVETIVPVVLTTDERIRALQVAKEDTQNQLDLVRVTLEATTTDPALVEKATVAFTLADEALASSTSLMGATDYDLATAESLMSRATLYAEEAMKILALSPVIRVTSTEVVQPSTDTATSTDQTQLVSTSTPSLATSTESVATTTVSR